MKKGKVNINNLENIKSVRRKKQIHCWIYFFLEKEVNVAGHHSVAFEQKKSYDDAKGEKYAEDEEAEAPLGETCAECHRRLPIAHCTSRRR